MPAASAASSAQQAAQNAALQNIAIRKAILANALRLKQPIFNQAWTPSNAPQLTWSPNYIGYLRRFIVEITGTVTNSHATQAATLSDIGILGLLDPNQGVVMTDLNGYYRIQTGLWHLLIIESMKRGKLYGARWTPETGTPWANAGAWTPFVQPSSSLAAAGGTSTFRLQFEIPVCYMPDDLRGGLFISVVNSTMRCLLNYNTSAFIASGSDDTFAVYSGGTVALSGVNVSVYQDYFDQLPADQNGQPALPLGDMSVVYELKKTQYSALAANVDNPFPFNNLRRYLSATPIFDSSPSASPFRQAGGDVNYWSLMTASLLPLWKGDPQMFSEMVRHQIGWDLPAGFYHFEFRRHPIYTPANGNMQLLLNPSSAAAQSIVHLGYEMFADVNLLTQASAIGGN